MPPGQLLGSEREVAFHQLGTGSFQAAFQPPRVVRFDAFDCEYLADYLLRLFGGESVADFAPDVGLAAQVEPRQPRLLQRDVGHDQPAVARRVEGVGCGRRRLAGGGRETAAAERRRREGGTRAVGIDEHLLALVAERDDFHAAVGKEPKGFVHVEQRRVLDAQTP